MSRMDEIKARCEKATVGPWGACSRNASNKTHDPAVDDDFLGWEIDGPESAGGRGQIHRGHDAAFIAHSRADVPYLVARVERLEEALRDLCSVAEECAQDADRHDVEDNIKRQLEPIHAAVAEARAALEAGE